jgi:hypothetical protein
VVEYKLKSKRKTNNPKKSGWQESRLDPISLLPVKAVLNRPRFPRKDIQVRQARSRKKFGAHVGCLGMGQTTLAWLGTPMPLPTHSLLGRNLGCPSMG